MNYTAWDFWVASFQFVLNASAWIYIVLSNRTKATTDQIKDAEKKMFTFCGDVEKRIDGLAVEQSKLEERMLNLPGHDSQLAMMEKINTIVCDMGRIAGTQTAMVRQLEVLTKLHMKEDKERR